MFTGIVEAPATVVHIQPEGRNVHFDLHCPFVSELEIDQSIAHNGACLTVVALRDDQYRVTAIDETLQRTNLRHLKSGDRVNIERCMLAGARLDGHIVQGHVDQTGRCESIAEEDGSWRFHFSYRPSRYHLTVPKGSICINGVSLTVAESSDDHFSVAIIPYTYEHTNFRDMKPGDEVNLEFDIIGKYLARLAELRES